jgi:hypothetical protein
MQCLGDPQSESRQEKKIFLFSKNVQTPPESNFSGFLGVEWQESDNDYSPPSTAEIHDDSGYTSTPPV